MTTPNEGIQAEPPDPRPDPNLLEESTRPPVSTAATSDDKTMAIFAYAGGFLTWLLAPIIVWSVKKDKSSWAEDHAREALNFQLALTIYYIVGCLIFPLIMVFELDVVIQAYMAASRGELYRYPLNIRFVK